MEKGEARDGAKTYVHTPRTRGVHVAWHVACGMPRIHGIEHLFLAYYSSAHASPDVTTRALSPCH